MPNNIPIDDRGADNGLFVGNKGFLRDEKLLDEFLNFDDMPNKVEKKKQNKEQKKNNLKEKIFDNFPLGQLILKEERNINLQVGEKGKVIMEKFFEEGIEKAIEPNQKIFEGLIDGFAKNKKNKDDDLHPLDQQPMWRNRGKIGAEERFIAEPPEMNREQGIFRGIRDEIAAIPEKGQIYKQENKLDQFYPNNKLEDRVVISLDHTANILAMNIFNERMGGQIISLSKNGTPNFADEFEEEFTILYDKFYDLLMTMKKS